MNALVIAPHADDEVLGCGGMMLSSTDPVSVLVISDRTIGHRVDPDYVSRTHGFARAATGILGVEELFFAGLQDEQLDARLIDVIMPIEEIVADVCPGEVYIPSGDDTNQDHRAVAEACLVACRWVDTVFEYEVPGSTRHFRPNWYLGMETDSLETKIRAFGSYVGEERSYPHPRSPEGLRIHAAARGLECGKPYAEAYRLQRRVQ